MDSVCLSLGNIGIGQKCCKLIGSFKKSNCRRFYLNLKFEIFELGGPRTVLEIDDFFLATNQNVTEVSFRTNLYGFLEL